jgi:hypothetical protein
VREAVSVREPGWGVAPREVMVWVEEGERERAVTVWPAERSSGRRARPMKPEAPVTKMCMVGG